MLKQIKNVFIRTFRRIDPGQAILPPSCQMSTVAVVIPAYNEGGKIGRVLAVLREVDSLNEIIVVDDGSSDRTVVEVEEAARIDPRARLIRHPVNRGKGAALLAGKGATRCQVLLFLDGDLIGLRPEQVRDLIEPVLHNRADMTLGLFRGGQRHTDFAHWVAPFLTGQRCLRADLLGHLSEKATAGYGMETALALAARRQNWRCQAVALRGVSHPSSEIHRGLRQGSRVRAGMYYDILNAWRIGQGWQLLLPRLRRRMRVALILTAVLLGSSLAYDRSLAAAHLRLDEFPTFPLAGVQRLLVIAPHPDDETLGAAGAIQQALAAGAEIKIVIVTNGEGQALGPLALYGDVFPHPADYIAHGRRRQAETLAAIHELGLPPDSAYFLGYPDGELDRLWLDDWTTGCPLRSRLTRAAKSPFPLTFNPRAEYCGRDLLTDLRAIISDFKPDLVLLPHPNDEHPDHRATGSFARMALALATQVEPGYRPAIWGYLIHYGYYPQPRGWHTHQTLLPPVPLSSEANRWARLDLTPQEVQVKANALSDYVTQQRLLGSFLPSFARQDELFANLQTAEITMLALSDLPLLETGVIRAPTFPEPAEESTRRLVLGGADLVGMQIGRLNSQLWIGVETRTALVAELNYRIIVKLPDGRTQIVSWPGSAIRPGRTVFAALLNRQEMGDPPVVGFSAEVRQGATLDRTGWHFVILRDGRP